MKVSSKIEKKLLHYTGKAIADYDMIRDGDRVLVCLSGGKDSFTLLKILHLLQLRTNNKFSIFVFTLNQSQPGFSDHKIRAWLEEKQYPFEIIQKDVYGIVKSMIKPTKTFCSFCSRLRRGIIYRYAKEHSFTKIALGHHRDDLIVSLLMSILYSGEIRSMPPKLLTNDKRHVLIRPLCYCQEQDILQYAQEQDFPITSCGNCSSSKNQMRKKVAQLIAQLAQDNPKVPSNMLHALSNVKYSQLMDTQLWNFRELEVIT